MPGELQQANAELIARIIRLGLGAAGVGAAVRGGLGLRDMLTDRNQLIEVPPLDKGLDEHEPTYSGKPPKRVQVHKAPRPVAIPVREKAAADGPGLGGLMKHYYGNMFSHGPKVRSTLTEDWGHIKDWWRGAPANTPQGVTPKMLGFKSTTAGAGAFPGGVGANITGAPGHLGYWPGGALPVSHEPWVYYPTMQGSPPGTGAIPTQARDQAMWGQPNSPGHSYNRHLERHQKLYRDYPHYGSPYQDMLDAVSGPISPTQTDKQIRQDKLLKSSEKAAKQHAHAHEQPVFLEQHPWAMPAGIFPGILLSHGSKAAGIGDHINFGIDQAGQFLSKMLPEGVFGGSSVQDPRNAPWVPAATVAGFSGGLYGGYKLMDWLLDKRRKHELSQRLHAARETYRQALQEGLRGKAAASPDSAVSTPVERLGQVFDTLVEHCDQEKTGLHLPLVGDIPEQALGWALLAHLGIAGAAGGAVYNYVKKRNNVEVLRKALRERARQRSAIRPEHLIAFAQPQAA